MTTTKRVALSPSELSLIEAFRTEKNIYNGALADAAAVLADENTPGGRPGNYQTLQAAILKLRKE